MTAKLSTPLSDEELDELDQFLMSDAMSDEAMVLDTLDGYLTAIVIGPATILPSQWLPGIWGESDDDAPVYESMEQAQRILELLLRHMNGIIWTLQYDAKAFDPLFGSMVYPDDPHEYVEGEMWAYGFMQGIALCRQDWQPLFDDPVARDALRPIRLLGADELTETEEALTRWPAQREELSLQLAASIPAIYRFWLPRRQEQHASLLATTFRRDGPKPGRNDPCPCGSGKKFKKCCGTDPTLH
jgi:uncharacterized protein